MDNTPIDGRALFMICKDTNSKAIHNNPLYFGLDGNVVYDMQRY